jgi:hypothetical protein
MESQLRPAAVAEHRGSYSSIRSAKSTLAAGIWTPPHSPTESMETEVYEERQNDKDTLVDAVKVEETINQEGSYPKEAQAHPQSAPSNSQGSSDVVPAEEEQQAELRLSDFQVVDTLGRSYFPMRQLIIIPERWY